MDENINTGSWVNAHPTIVLGIAIFLALFLGGFFLAKKGGTSPSLQSPSQGDLSGLDVDANGNHIVYRDVSDVWYNTSIIEGSYNTSNTSTTTTTTTTNNGPPPIIHPNPPPHTPVPPPPHPSGWTCTYVVRGGDSLSGIGIKYGVSWHDLYTHNQSIIDSVSHAHGNPIPGGPWNNIFPGEVLKVPCK